MSDGRVVEQEINARAKRQMMSYLEGAASFIDVYLYAQHYGLPTRLLDWTTNPLTSLFFAAQPPDDVDGSVFMIYPTGHHYYDFYAVDGTATRRIAISPVQPEHEAFIGQVKYVFNERVAPFAVMASGPDEHMIQLFSNQDKYKMFPQALEGVLTVVPSLRFSRIAAQEGCFTFHPPDCGDITSLAMRFAIPRTSKSELRIALRRMGVTRASLFRDIEGVALSLVDLLNEFPPPAPMPGEDDIRVQ
jgi:hypothetical protein